MQKTLYLSDLDGTLLGADSLVSATSKSLLNEAIAQGALFSIATARTPATVAYLLEGINIALPTVVMTGSALWNPADGLYSDMRFIGREQVGRALDIYRRCALPTFVYTLEDNHITMYHIGAFNEHERRFYHERIGNPYKELRIASRGEPDLLPPDLDKVILLFGIQPADHASRVADELRRATDCYVNCYNDLTYGTDYNLLEVFAPGSSKAAGAATLATALGADRIVAFGDNINDLPLLRMADVAVAVGNAVEEVKREADIIIGPNTDDSVPRAILDDIHSAGKTLRRAR